MGGWRLVAAGAALWTGLVVQPDDEWLQNAVSAGRPNLTYKAGSYLKWPAYSLRHQALTEKTKPTQISCVGCRW
jgi:hypothetical protein